MRHLEEWLEAHKPPQITMALPGNPSKGKPLSFDSVFQGITINLQQNKKSFPDLVSFLFPSHTNPIIFHVYFNALAFFLCYKELAVLEADFSQLGQRFKLILVHFAVLFPLLFCVCGRWNKRKR